MMGVFRRVLTILLALHAYCLVYAEGPYPNLIPDGDFEAPSRHWIALSGKIAPVKDAKLAHSGEGVLRLAAAQQGANREGRLYCARRIEVVHGGRYVCSVWAKGTGTADVGVYEYDLKDGSSVFLKKASLPSPAPLSETWQLLKIVYRPSGENVKSVALFAQVFGEGGNMLADDMSFAVSPDPPLEIALPSTPSMAAAGGELAAPVSVKGGAPDVGGVPPALDVVLRDDQGNVAGRGTLSAARKAALKLPENLDGCCALSVVEKQSGAVAFALVDVCSKAEYDACAAAAAQAKLRAPCHLVFVGDSLTALYKGHNYVDKVRGWLQGRLGDQALVTNAGVGGDTITRVQARLEKDVLALQPKPTHVFIFLGHNDSKLKSTTDYKEPVVLPADYDKQYREVVQAVQTKLGAKVAILSATSSVYEITKETAAKAAASGKAHSFFGKPEALEQFNAIARKVAADLGADYIDVYEPTRLHADKASLFTRDGVHINEKGNRLVALEVLKYLGR